MFKNINDALNWFIVQPKFKEKQDLDLVLKAFGKLNLDLSQIKKIHVAGTNGKGSTTSYLTHVLMENGFKVGSFTSPYLVNFNERIRINFSEISDDKLLELINFIYKFNLDLNNNEGFFLSFFEMITLISLIYFYENKCDVIIMEVGIGGLLDATNIINYDVSIITNIGFDHMKQLGNDLESIALNKLGIV